MVSVNIMLITYPTERYRNGIIIIIIIIINKTVVLVIPSIKKLYHIAPVEGLATTATSLSTSSTAKATPTISVV